jgi:hypothetical protein
VAQDKMRNEIITIAIFFMRRFIKIEGCNDMGISLQQIRAQ